MEIVTIIPARGGSKGIPRKNVRSLAGKPLITHTIESARQCSTICATWRRGFKEGNRKISLLMIEVLNLIWTW